MLKQIDKHIEQTNEALAWAHEFGKEGFQTREFKDYRRRLNKIRRALDGKCSAAAYGESQVGKSYLMSSLLSSPDHPFVIANNGRNYSFIDELNPSGGNNTQVESTGVITRFTVADKPSAFADMVKIENLSVVDIILLLTDSYYNDIKIDPANVLLKDQINNRLDALAGRWQNKPRTQAVVTDDDVYDIMDYLSEVIGSPAANIVQSGFARTVAAFIENVPSESWAEVFGLLWNDNAELTRLFNTLINAYRLINFTQKVYVPFDAVLRKKGTLLKINWLDSVCGCDVDYGDEVTVTDVYDAGGNLLARDFDKGQLSALVAELTFELPADVTADRPFLRDMDLLDFPGARSREKFQEKEISKVLPQMLRRGKVAYLFNKYSRQLKISCVLFCHHNSQKSEATLGDTVTSWLEENIGATAEERSRMLADTNGVSPFMMVATKFNIDLELTKNDTPADPSTLDKHWSRFDTVIPEIFKAKSWLGEWTRPTAGSQAAPFRSIYPLRDFYWSSKNRIFDGYSEGETKSAEKTEHHYDEYPNYLSCLRKSFMNNTFVKRHFDDPAATWQGCATVNNDGSKAIINALNRISGVLDAARRARYHAQLTKIRDKAIAALEVYYEPEDTEAKDKKVRTIARDLRMSLTATVSVEPAAFGRMLDKFMFTPEPLRNIAYDILVRHTDTPRDFGPINFLRASAGVDVTADRAVNVGRLLDYLLLDSESELNDYCRQNGYALDDVLARAVNSLSTPGAVLAKHMVDAWTEHLNHVAGLVADTLPHADEIVFMLTNIWRKLNITQRLTERFDSYIKVFNQPELLNAIADYAALTFNNFVSSVGRQYMSDDEVRNLQQKAQRCNLPVDFSPAGWNRTRTRQPLIATLKVLDEASAIIDGGHPDVTALRKLPFWDNYKRWENFVFIGLVFSADISNVDPRCNARVRELIDAISPLYR